MDLSNKIKSSKVAEEISSPVQGSFIYKKKAINKKDILILKDDTRGKFTDEDIDKLMQQIGGGSEQRYSQTHRVSQPSISSNLNIGSKTGRSTITEKELITAVNEIEKEKEQKEDFGSYLFERNNLILRILNLCKEKFYKTHEEYLAKAVNWIIIEIQDSLIFKSDDRIFRIIEKNKDNNKDLQDVFNWLREYSSVKEHIDHNIYDVDIKHKNKGITSDLSVVDETFSFLNMSKALSGNTSFSVSVSEESIAKVEEPNFNIFTLEKEVGTDNVLITISCYIFITLGLYSQINYNSFERVLVEIAKGYNKTNHYHNDIHAADVEQTCFMYLKYGKIAEKLNLNNMDLAALLVSAIIHDFKHPGRTNQFLINTNNELSILYNGKFVIYMLISYIYI
jgi:hypothetical protein